ncbi:GPP34 family phosphoprotein [Micromonospora sp. NPDC005324]|uniref:GOLPH3/VPS74 family protein n=1 Tax=Micromonospora sp. NPDC005324 TaxID=3157033 RepID=UPI0033BF147D
MTSASAPLPLRDELFLLGHDDDTGQPHLYRQALAVGLAGAVLIDLFLAGRVGLASGDGGSDGEQCVGLHLDQPVGDLVADAAIASLRQARSAPPLRPWLRGFAEDLYERTRAGLQEAGILRHEVRRRFGGLARIDCYLSTDTRWAVVARARLRHLAAGRHEPTNHTAALAGLVVTLGLTSHLYLGEDTAAVAARLRVVAGQHHRPVCEITAAVDAAVGDLATAAYR